MTCFSLGVGGEGGGDAGALARQHCQRPTVSLN
jgi:hypothetical protein